MKIGFLITCYRQVVPTINNIKRIRQYDDLGDSPIVVVCTAEEPIFNQEDLNGAIIHYIHDGPGSNKSNFISKSAPVKELEDDYMALWRHKYITAAILYSIADGLRIAHELGCTHVAHLHSDTYWEHNYANTITRISNLLTEQDKIIYIDINGYLESEQILPPKFAWHPEGSIYNLEACKKYGNFGFNFKEIYNSPNTAQNYIDKNCFWSNQWSCTEFLVSQWLLWCYSKTIVDNYYSRVPQEFYDKFETGLFRAPHGRFSTGLVNEPGMQIRREPPKPIVVEYPKLEKINDAPVKKDNGWRNPWKRLVSYWTT